MQFRIGTETVNSYKRLSYTPWHAIAEFVDNSTQAYFDNKDALDAAFASEGQKLWVSIVYDRDARTLTIRDNSIGMNLAEVEEALMVAGHAPRATGRSKYGMGMKTAACWFGDRWQIKTKRLGGCDEVTAHIDTDAIASGKVDVPYRVEDTGDPAPHYTELTISDLHSSLHTRTIGKIKLFLASMYRCDLRDGILDLFWQTSPLTWQEIDDRVLLDEHSQPYRKLLDFDVLGHRVHGWVAVLASGGRPFAGFTILQNNRVIKGYPDAWRPQSIFGQVQGSNDLVNQRLVGEIHLDTFQVSHTKDDIVWSGDEEEALERALQDQCQIYRAVARRAKVRDQRGPTPEMVDYAVDELRRDLGSSQLVDQIELTEELPADVVDTAFEAVVAQEANRTPRIDMSVGTRQVQVHLSESASVNDPYFAIDFSPDEAIIVVINMNHPYVKFVADPAAMTSYLRHCVFDAIATHKARIKKGEVHFNTFQTYKDQLLRVPDEIHDLEREVLLPEDEPG